ncbi:transposase [Phyllobacterium bourgognense]|uniref:Transposase n=1 Tax=Phyllobacterium bourgognense TaxID=314236 RepID=A0A368YH92_9HYPH|nr:transposase [Phyllobacterium bourgognense]
MAESTGYGRAVDQDGYVLDEIVQSRRNTKAARRLLKRLLRKQGMAPKRMITDKLRSYGAARRQLMAHGEHRSHKGLNNRAENSHVPLRKRERVMQGFRSPDSLQRFVSIFSAVRNLFVPPRISRFAFQIHLHRLGAMAEWKNQITASINPFANKVTTPSTVFAIMRDLAMRFNGILRSRNSEALDEWIDDAIDTELTAIMRFASVLRRDIDAVKNAIELPWSNGQAEGQINRLKMLKRAMYGRAGPELMRARMLLLNHRN